MGSTRQAQTIIGRSNDSLDNNSQDNNSQDNNSLGSYYLACSIANQLQKQSL